MFLDFALYRIIYLQRLIYGNVMRYLVHYYQLVYYTFSNLLVTHNG